MTGSAQTAPGGDAQALFASDNEFGSELQQPYANVSGALC